MSDLRFALFSHPTRLFTPSDGCRGNRNSPATVVGTSIVHCPGCTAGHELCVPNCTEHSLITRVSMAGVRDVRIVLHSARDVRKPSLFSKVYPIAVVTLPGVSEQSFQTKRPVKADDDPAWQEAFVFNIPADAIKPQTLVGNYCGRM